MFEQEIEPVSWLFVLISFLSGLVVGSVFTCCCCISREPAQKSDEQWLVGMAMNQAPRLVGTGDHVDLSRGYIGLRVAVTYEDDPGDCCCG